MLVYLKSTFDLSVLLFSSGSVKVPESKVLPSTHVVADLLGIPRYFACTMPSNLRRKRAQNKERYRFKTVNAERKLLGQPRVPATKLILRRKGLPRVPATKLILRRKGLVSRSQTLDGKVRVWYRRRSGTVNLECGRCAMTTQADNQRKRSGSEPAI